MTGEMTGNQAYEQPMLGIQYFSLDSPLVQPTSSSSLAFASAAGSASASDKARSPGGRTWTSHLHSDQSTARQAPGGVESVAGGSSLSPGERLILTPTSTNVEYNASTSEDQRDDDDNDGDSYDLSSGISPTSTTHTTDGEFVYVSHSFPAGRASRMNNQPPPATADSGASRASSVAPPASSNATSLAGQWGSFPSTTNGWMDYQSGNYARSDSFNNVSGGYLLGDQTFPPTDQFNSDLLSDVGTFDNGDITGFNANLPFHIAGQNQYRIGSPFAQPFVPAHQHQQYAHNNTIDQTRQHAQYLIAQHQMRNAPGGNFDGRLNMAATSSAPIQQPPTQYTAPLGIKQEQPTPSHVPVMDNITRRPFGRTGPYPQPQRPLPPSAVQVGRRRSSTNTAQQATSAGSSTTTTRPLHVIAKAEPGIAQSTAARQSQLERNRRGGRQKHSHLPEKARQKSHKMRKLTACWRCALQRDPVSILINATIRLDSLTMYRSATKVHHANGA